MAFLLTCAVKDLRRRIADPLALVLWLAMPLLIGGLMIVMLGGDDAAPPTARVLLVDEDDSLAGRLISGAAGSSNVEFLDVETVTRDEGRARMDAGEASALVVLPAGFSEAIVNQTPATIEFVRNPSERILPGIVQTGLEILVELIHYVQQLLGEPLRQMLDATPDSTAFPASDVVALFSGSVTDQLNRVRAWLLPPALTVEFVSPDGGEAAGVGGVNFGALFLPSMLFMAVLFIAQGMADDLWDEKDAGTLRRAVALPRPIGVFLAGKLVTAAVIMTAVGLVSLLVLESMDAVTFARMPAALAWTVFGGTALYCFFLALQLLASSRRGASILSNIVLFPVMMIGGAFFPFEAMPAWMGAVGRWTPNGQALVQFKAIIAGTAAPADVALAALAIGVPAAVIFVMCSRMLTRRFVAGA